MSNIKTWQSRITTKSSDDDILEYKQTEIDELRAALAKAEQENQILAAEKASLESACDRRDAHIAALAAQEPIGTVYTGSATRDGFRIIWAAEGHSFPDGITKLYAAAGAVPGDIRALKHRIHELEGEVIGYKRIVSDSEAAGAVTPCSKCAELAAQEPVARFNWDSGNFEWLTKYKYDLHHMKPLYLAAGAAPAPEGWQLVPVEPTDAMLRVDIETDAFVGIDDARNLYKAMLAVAPKETSNGRS